MKLIKVASLGTDSKVCYDALGIMFNVPENFRKTIKIGDFCTIISKHFDRSTVINEDTGVTSLTGPAFDREQVSSIGTKAEILANAGESKLLDKELELWVAKETAVIAKEYDLSKVGAA